MGIWDVVKRVFVSADEHSYEHYSDARLLEVCERAHELLPQPRDALTRELERRGLSGESPGDRPRRFPALAVRAHELASGALQRDDLAAVERYLRRIKQLLGEPV